jgi:hypothetical protein
MKKNVWITVIFVLFYVLLLWPVYVLASYMFFSTFVRNLLFYILPLLELVIGIFCVWWTWANRKEKSKGKFIAHMIVICVFFAIFLFTFVNNFVLALLMPVA